MLEIFRPNFRALHFIFVMPLLLYGQIVRHNGIDLTNYALAIVALGALVPTIAVVFAKPCPGPRLLAFLVAYLMVYAILAACGFGRLSVDRPILVALFVVWAVCYLAFDIVLGTRSRWSTQPNATTAFQRLVDKVCHR